MITKCNFGSQLLVTELLRTGKESDLTAYFEKSFHGANSGATLQNHQLYLKFKYYFKFINIV